MKDFLKNLIKRKEEEKEEMMQRSEKSKDVAEVREIGKKLEVLKREIDEAKEQLEKIEEEEKRMKQDPENLEARREIQPENAELRNGWVMGSYQQNIGKEKRMKQDPTNTEEYRMAFMEYVCRNKPIPTEIRVDATTTTGDVGAVIPKVYLDEIIQEMETYGNVYALVRKLNVQGGVAIPVLTLKPTATWIGEEQTSEDQKLQANETVTFSYFGIECKIAQTLLANVTTLESFQKTFIPLATEAIVKGVEIAIFRGNGTTQPLGILNDKRVKTEKIIEMTEEEFTSWTGWHKKVKAKMKKAYRNGTFFMNQGTFDGYIDGMVDKSGQPIGRVNYGINGEETYRFMGKSVETVEDGCLPSYDDAEQGDVVAVFLKPSDYAINSNMQMIVVKWTDNDNNKVKNKAIMICDGKLIDPNGVIIIKKAGLSA